MSLEELKEGLNGNTLSYGTLNASALANIMMFVNVNLQMDRSTFDYYYEIDVDALLKSRMPIGELDSLKKQGWAFSNDEKTLILYLKS